MRIIVYILFLCALPAIGFGQSSDLINPPSRITNSNKQPQDLSEQDCWELENKGRGYSNGFKYQMAYDTLRHFIEQCALLKDAWQTFGEITPNADVLFDKDKEMRYKYRDWLKSVLYLNTDTFYYCADAIQIARTYVIRDDSVDVLGNEAVTVCKYLLDSSNCKPFKDEILSVWHNLARYWQVRHWRDTVADSLKTPLDTGYTTIDALGLQILRGPMNDVVPDIRKPLNKHPIVEARAIPNPIKDEVEFWYKLIEGALVEIEVYDALGKQMYSLAQGYKPEGENRLHLDTRSWSRGSYYVRFTTLGGEVKTIKLLKE